MIPSLLVPVSLFHYALGLHLAGGVLGHLLLGGSISDDLWFLLAPWRAALSPGAPPSSGSPQLNYFLDEMNLYPKGKANPKVERQGRFVTEEKTIHPFCFSLSCRCKWERGDASPLDPQARLEPWSRPGPLWTAPQLVVRSVPQPIY